MPHGRSDYTRRAAAGFLVALALHAPMLGGCTARKTADPVAEEIHRWSAYLRADTSSGEIAAQVRAAAAPLVAEAESALAHGQRLYALQRLAPARTNLAGWLYASRRPEGERAEFDRFEAEWKRMATELRAELAPTAPDAFARIEPAAIRAFAETAMPQVKVYYDASLDYGRSTTPEFGLIYLGVAEAQRQFVAFLRSLPSRRSGRAPPLRDLAIELDSLETQLLEAYRPPASIDLHPQFIAASSLLKEARELNAMGLRRGALLRYLQTSQRLALLGTPATPSAADVIEPRLREAESRLAVGVDHTIARVFLEAAAVDLRATPPESSHVVAAAVVDEVLPRYFAALGPAPQAPPAPTPEATVTLVRWPYT